MSAQNKTANPDVLLREIHLAKSDTDRIGYLLQLGNYYLFKPNEYKQDLDSANKYYTLADLLSHRIRSATWQNKTLFCFMGYYYESRDPKKTRLAFEQLVSFYHKQGEKFQEAKIYEDYALKLNYTSTDPAFLKQLAAYHETALKLFLQTGQKVNAIETRRNLADTHMQMGKLDDAERELIQVIKQFKAVGYTNLTYPYDLLAEVNYRKGNQPKELFYRLTVLAEIDAAHPEAPERYWRYLSVDHLHQLMGDYDHALLWINKILNAGENVVGTMLYCSAVLYRTDALISKAEFVEANSFLIKQRANSNKSFAARIYINQASGNYFTAIKKYDLAEKYYARSLNSYNQFDKRHEKKFLYAQLIQSIGHFYVTAGKYEKAGYYLGLIEKYPNEIIAPIQQAKIQHELFKVDSATGNFIAAIDHFELHKRITDSLFTVDKVRQLNEINVKYETSQKEQTIKSLKSNALAQQARVEKANLQRNFTIAGIIVVVHVAGQFYYSYRQKQRSNKIILKSHEMITQKNIQLQHLLEEKEWLLKEVHHRVKNNLHTVICLLESQAVFLEKDALKAIETSQNRIYTMSLIHQKLYQSEDIKTINMEVYVPELIKYLSESHESSTHIEFTYCIEPLNFNAGQAIPIALIINEAISNAIKHAFSPNYKGKISIKMSCNARQVCLTLEDNGIGMNINSTPKKNSLGLSLMKGLCEDINGEILFENDHGTKIKVTFPYNQG
ncbi:tetratricopeptide repeat-containing sensor histidine kinase [Mucilaginibacter celer]|uniref:histidine kinase n=1 Tax=Mucilaginibacter celer TaxID=2305508 RepID=A0A494VLJ1_9SPHI|nr:histidine kinase dimerization/phosphoacceptor domain -containing protein [Mucilaginibacter celer]AYL95404.1 hypothetical protein HYN43_008915 [Mucilaginibacter celer]